ncbi:Putative ribonuclease H protein At1g65750 [Linum perenne]
MGVRMLSERDDEMHGMVVSDLLIPELYEWDLELVEDLLGSQEAERVKGMRPPRGNEEDERIWHFSGNGLYTVRSAYRLLTSNDAEHVGLRVGGNWRKLWQVEVPPKIKHHVWRLARNVLPTRTAIRSRGIDAENICGCCGLEEEQLEHLFFGCVVAERCWREAGIGHLLEMTQQVEEDATSWLFRIIDTASCEQVQRTFVVLWVIWKERNDRVWNHQSRPPELVVRNGWDQVEEWRLAQNRRPERVDRDQRTECRQWHKPERGRVKVNVDAAFFREQRKIGVGIVARDSSGHLLGYTARLHQGTPTPKEAEALGMADALQWTMDMQLGPVTIETDSQLVCQALRNDAPDITDKADYLSKWDSFDRP